MASPSEFSSEVRTKLREWFVRYGPNPKFEIEARIRDVTEVGFNSVLQKLLSNRGWSNTPAPEDTLDLVHATGVRETRHMTGASFLRKQKWDNVDVMTRERSVRFAVASEEATREDTSPVQTWRWKQRTTFVHKRAFKFELTKVKQGGSEQEARGSEPIFEIEIEFCGQTEAVASNHDYCVDSLLMKVSAGARV